MQHPFDRVASKKDSWLPRLSRAALIAKIVEPQVERRGRALARPLLLSRSVMIFVLAAFLQHLHFLNGDCGFFWVGRSFHLDVMSLMVGYSRRI